MGFILIIKHTNISQSTIYDEFQMLVGAIVVTAEDVEEYVG